MKKFENILLVNSFITPKGVQLPFERGLDPFAAEMIINGESYNYEITGLSKKDAALLKSFRQSSPNRGRRHADDYLILCKGFHLLINWEDSMNPPKLITTTIFPHVLFEDLLMEHPETILDHYRVPIIYDPNTRSWTYDSENPMYIDPESAAKEEAIKNLVKTKKA